MTVNLKMNKIYLDTCKCLGKNKCINCQIYSAKLEGYDLGRKEAFEEVNKIVDEVLEHSNEDHPEMCGCYMCHHQEEYQDIWKELKTELNNAKADLREVIND